MKGLSCNGEVYNVGFKTKRSQRVRHEFEMDMESSSKIRIDRLKFLPD